MPNEKQIRAERNRQFIDRVERLRVERGITKAEMYKGIGVSAAAFSQWKSGAHSISDKAITKAAQFFGVSEIWLLTGIETEKAATPDGSGDLDEAIQLLKTAPPEVRDAVVRLLKAAAHPAEAPGV